MKVVVLGAHGQLGRALAAHIGPRHETLAWSRGEVDVTASAAVRRRLTEARPDAIVNASAFAQVDAAEDHPLDAFAVNAWAVRDLAQIAASIDAVLVHYSTDFVFDGIAPGPYAEDHPTHPRGVYAVSKRAGEWFAADAPRHYVLRVESLFGGQTGAAAKSSVDVMLANLRAGRGVKAFADRTVSPSFVHDVAAASLALVERRAPHGIYHCVNSGCTTWLGVAQELARLAGADPSLIEPTQMAGLPMRVARPLNAALSNAKLAAAGVPMPSWQDALARYVAPSA